MVYKSSTQLNNCQHHISQMISQQLSTFAWFHDDVIKWKHFPRYWPFVREIHRSPVNSPHNGQWRGALMLSLIFAWITGWVNNGEAGDLRRHRAHYDVTVMYMRSCKNIMLSYIVISSSSTFKLQPPWWNHYQHTNFDAWKFWQLTLSWT